MKKATFSLTELLVVIAILVILMSMVSPSLNRMMENARRVQCSQHISKGIVALTNYLSDFDDQMPYNNRKSYRYVAPWATYAVFSQNRTYNHGLFKKEGYLDSRETYYCPSMRPTALYSADGRIKRGFSKEEYPEPWPSVPKGDWVVRTSYYFNPNVNGNRTFKYRRGIDYPNDRAVWMDIMQNSENGMSHNIDGSVGWFLGMIDGSVQFSESDSVYTQLYSVSPGNSWSVFKPLFNELHENL